MWPRRLARPGRQPRGPLLSAAGLTVHRHAHAEMPAFSGQRQPCPPQVSLRIHGRFPFVHFIVQTLRVCVDPGNRAAQAKVRVMQCLVGRAGARSRGRGQP